MQNARRLIVYLSSIIGIWVLVSFGGAMIDSANAAFWSSSLMWALLSFLVVMPALVLVHHASTQASQQPQSVSQQPTASETEQTPFVEEESDEVRTLWPEPDQDQEWPAQNAEQEEKPAQM